MFETAIAEELIGEHILSSRSVAGGDINEAYALETSSRRVFLKVQTASHGTEMFEAEVAGLRALRRANAITVPEPIGVAATDHAAYLAMEYIEETPAGSGDWSLAGKRLAKLHSSANSRFGFESNNYIGSLPQQNTPSTSWTDYYLKNRLGPMFDRARGAFNGQDLTHWNTLVNNLPRTIHCEQPSLLHGDLWSGNIMHSRYGPVLYDPAVYFGDRLVDIAMARLFQGFPDQFYSAYFDEWPIGKDVDLQQRIAIYQLYYLLVHVILFGNSYMPSVRHILATYK